MEGYYEDQSDSQVLNWKEAQRCFNNVKERIERELQRAVMRRNMDQAIQSGAGLDALERLRCEMRASWGILMRRKAKVPASGLYGVPRLRPRRKARREKKNRRVHTLDVQVSAGAPRRARPQKRVHSRRRATG